MWDWYSFIVGLVCGAVGVFIVLAVYAWYSIMRLRNKLKIPQMGILKPQDKSKESKKKKKR